MRYFSDRNQAGQLLAQRLQAYASQNCAVVSLSEGGVVVGLEIAKQIHASLYLLTTEKIELPGEPEPIAMLSSAGTFTYNNAYSTGELESISADYHYLIEGKKLEAFQKLNRVASEEGDVPKDLLKNHVVILVSDGFRNALSLDIAADFLKPIKVKKLIVATSIASVPAVDRMHLLADEIHCLGVIEDYIDTPHYYEDNSLPEHKQLIAEVDRVIVGWKNPDNQIK